MMFSLLSQGYGTYDGRAKKDPQEIPDQKDYFSLEDLHLPPIGSNYRVAAPLEVSDYQTGPRYENKPFKLPKVENTKQSAIHVPKTFTTRKGALLLYAEDFFPPGSPKPRKKRHRIKKQTPVKLKTMGDLRNFILDYKKNGGDPLFLALLQKRLSGYKDQSVRPGFSPKRYIATLGNSLQEDTWNKLAATGSIKDPAVLTFDPKLAPMHGDGAMSTLFPDKPQPYSTMSLPPLSPSSSMFESSFHFYKNGMSTGAASLISLNSETEEYAPSSRALSPTESLSNRLSEVEFLPQRKDPYAQLNAKQKEDLLSQLLLQKTLDSMNSDLSDLQGWVTNYQDHRGGEEHEPAATVTLPKSKAKHRGSLKSGSLTSIPRLPPIQSARARPTTPVELTQDRTLPQISSDITADQQRHSSSDKEGETDDILDPGSIHLDLSSLDECSLLADHKEGGEDFVSAEETDYNVKEDDSKQEDSAEKIRQSPFTGTSEEAMEPLDVVHNEEPVPEEHSTGEESIVDQGMTQNDGVIALDDIVLSSGDTMQDQHASQDVKMESNDDAEQLITEREETSLRADEEAAEGVERDDGKMVDNTEGVTQADGEPVMTEQADVEPREMGSENGDEGIGLDGEELGDNTKQDTGEELNQAEGAAAMEEGMQSPEPVELPPPISLEELQGEARTVANRVLSRPQSGMVFMEDVKTAIAMWADRLTNLLGPPKPDARVSSASQQRPGLAHEGVTSRPTRYRKVSRSAGPSIAALRKALKISGGEIPEIESLRNLPPLPERFHKHTRPHPPSGVTSGHAHYEPLKDGSVSTKGSASSGAARSIPWERVSNADMQVDIFSYATTEPSFQRVQADEIADEESDEDDEKFKTALNAIVTEVKPDYTLIEAKSRMAVSSPKKDQQPFKFPRPIASKPPPGLQNKQAAGQAKGKAKPAPAKKAAQAKKKAGKKPSKQQTKPGKAVKGAKGKTEAPKKEEQQKKTEDVSEKIVEEVAEEKPEPVRVDSETGEHEPESSDRTAASSVLSRDTSARISSKASDELNESKTDLPSDSVASVPEIPRIVPKPPESLVTLQATPQAAPQAAPLAAPQAVPQAALQAVPQEPEEKQPSPAEDQKQAQESRAARRAAERAAAAERRRQEVERKRKEREEAKKRAIEEEARLEQLRLEAEEEMKKREEERRQRRQEKEDAKQRERDEELERERQAKLKAEKEHRAREEWRKRQQQVLAQRKLEEEMRREREKIETELEAARLREEEERIKAMEKSERIAFLEKMRQEEEELRRRLEEQKRKEEEERRLREDERRQREEALAVLRQKQLQRHLFIAGILKESHYLSLCRRLTRAFTFSYFDLLPWNHLQHLVPAPSPVRDLLSSVKENIPPTIMEEDENVED